MTLITLRILDGPQRGTIYNQVSLPVTIGREEGNVIRLTDERVSRYHVKIHEQDHSLLLSDLQSTNGTRINGEVVSSWLLRPGDLIFLGRSILLFGTSDEIAGRLHAIRMSSSSGDIGGGGAAPLEVMPEILASVSHAFSSSAGGSGGGRDSLSPEESASGDGSVSPITRELFRGMTLEDVATLYRLAPPALPAKLSAKQSAQLAELLQYFQLRLRYLVGSIKASTKDDDAASAEKPRQTPSGTAAPAPPSSLQTSHGESTQQRRPAEPSGGEVFALNPAQWQNLLDLYGRVALYLRAIDEHR